MGSSARFTTATSTMTRTNMTAQASRMPQVSAAAFCGLSRPSLANDKVTAVDDTRPPVNPVSAVPRAGPSMRVST